MKEIWKAIEGTRNTYEVSNFGRVRKNGIPPLTGSAVLSIKRKSCGRGGRFYGKRSGNAEGSAFVFVAETILVWRKTRAFLIPKSWQ